MDTMNTLIQEFHQNLEDIVSWIQDAEELLQSHEEADDPEDVSQVRREFQNHEEFMAEVAEYQKRIDEVTDESQVLISSQETRPTQRAEIRKQRDLLIIRWNKLKNRSTDRQSHLQDSLMLLQQKQLDNMKAWLIYAEDRIGAFTEPGPDLESILQQMEEQKRFQEEVASQQEVVNSLAGFLLVEEEGNDEVEDQLTALGEKWAHVCRFVEERGSVLETTARGWQLLVEEETSFNSWICKLDKRLTEMEDAAAETESESEFVSDLIRRLQKLEEEMEKQHIHYSEIADEGQKLLQRLDKKSIPAIEVGRILERLTETWDSTVQRMDNLGQALTTAASLRRSRETNGGSRRDAGSRWKKRRIDSEGVREWQRALETASTWMGRIEGDLGLDEPEQGSVVWEELAIEEQQILLEDTETAVDAKRPQIELLIGEGQQLLRELDSSECRVSFSLFLPPCQLASNSCHQSLLSSGRRCISTSRHP